MLKPLSLFLLLGCLLTASQTRVLSAPSERLNPLPAQSITLYIGTYTKHPEGGILATLFNPQTGELAPARTLAVTPNPSFLAASPDGRFLYAVNEWGQVAGQNEGGLSAFQIEPATGQLSPLGAVAMGGTLCHLTVDATGKWLLATAYNAGTVSTWSLRTDGSIGPHAPRWCNTVGTARTRIVKALLMPITLCCRQTIAARSSPIWAPTK